MVYHEMVHRLIMAIDYLSMHIQHLFSRSIWEKMANQNTNPHTSSLPFNCSLIFGIDCILLFKHSITYLTFTCSLWHFVPKRHVLVKKYVQMTIVFSLCDVLRPQKKKLNPKNKWIAIAKVKQLRFTFRCQINH